MGETTILLLSLLEKSPVATAKPKHFAGFIFAPPYPGAIAVVTTATTPKHRPTRAGARWGPKIAACRGSRPEPAIRSVRREYHH